MDQRPQVSPPPLSCLEAVPKALRAVTSVPCSWPLLTGAFAATLEIFRITLWFYNKAWQRVPVTCLRVQLERPELGRGGRRWRGSASAVSSPRTGPREKGSTCLRRGRAAPPALFGRGFSRPVGCHFPVHARRSASTRALLQSLTPGTVRADSIRLPRWSRSRSRTRDTVSLTVHPYLPRSAARLLPASASMS